MLDIAEGQILKKIKSDLLQSEAFMTADSKLASQDWSAIKAANFLIASQFKK